MTHFNIEIVSDVICPWCYIGYKRLQKGIALYRSQHPSSASTDTFTTTWTPFFLQPDAPRGGIDKREFYRLKFGEERARAIHAMLERLGEEEGIAFRFGGRIGATRDAHRLLHLSKSHSPTTQTRLATTLFAAYFEQEKDLTSATDLLDAAEAAGLPRAEAKAWLESGKGGEEVDREVSRAVERGIQGVPHFTVNGWEVGGAQGAEVFAGVFERVRMVEGEGGKVECVDGDGGRC